MRAGVSKSRGGGGVAISLAAGVLLRPGRAKKIALPTPKLPPAPWAVEEVNSPGLKKVAGARERR